MPIAAQTLNGYQTGTGTQLLREWQRFSNGEQIDRKSVENNLKEYEFEFRYLSMHAKFTSEETFMILRTLYSTLDSDMDLPAIKETLSSVMSNMPFIYTLQCFLESNILDVLSSGPAVKVLLFKDVISARALSFEDPDALEFIHDNKVMTLLLKRVFEVDGDQLMFAVLQFILKFNHIWPNEPSLYEWEFLKSYTSGVFENNDLFDCYCTALQVLAGLVNPPAWVRDLFTIDWTPMLKIVDKRSQEGMVVMTSRLCCNIMDTVCYEWIRDLVKALITILKVYFKEEEHVITSICLPDLVQALSRNPEKAALIDCELFLQDVPGSMFDTFFMVLPFSYFANKQEIYEGHFAERRLTTTDLSSFNCMVRLIDDKDFFTLLKSDKLTTENLKKLPQDRLYIVLSRMSKHEYSTKYLLEEMPYIVSTFLIKVDRNVVNSEVWALKKEVLLNLIELNNYPLGIWEKDLKLCLYEICNGRRIREVAPSVEVTDMAM